jgi:hypothetical protein
MSTRKRLSDRRRYGIQAAQCLTDKYEEAQLCSRVPFQTSCYREVESLIDTMGICSDRSYTARLSQLGNTRALSGISTAAMLVVID